MKEMRKNLFTMLFCLTMVFVIPAPKSFAKQVYDVRVSKELNYASKDEILARINEIRREFYEENQRNHYVDNYEYTPIKWSSDLEEIAFIRAVEASVKFSHTRPNGEDCWTVKSSNGKSSYGEIIASSSNAVSAVNQWYGEKDDYIKELRHESHGETGHYTQMLYSKYIGIASFGVTAGETSSSPGASETQIAKAGTVTTTVKIGADDAKIILARPRNNTSYEQLKDTLTISTGNNVKLLAKLKGDWSTMDAVGTWSTSDKYVVSVDQNGKISGVGGGTATITFTDGPFTSSLKVTVSGAPYSGPRDVDSSASSTSTVTTWTTSGGNVIAVDNNNKPIKVTGVVTWRNYNLLVVNGAFYKKTTFFQDKRDGKWKYFVNGIQQKSGDTFVYQFGRLWHVKNGELCRTDGFVRYNGAYIYSYQGMAATFYTGWIRYAGYKCYLQKGVLKRITR